MAWVMFAWSIFSMESVLPQLKPGGERARIRKIKLQIKDVKETAEKKKDTPKLFLATCNCRTHLIEACSLSCFCINIVTERTATLIQKTIEEREYVILNHVQFYVEL